MNDFSTSFADLQAVIAKACRRNDEWPARVAAGIYAALDFAAHNPKAARTLTADSAGSDSAGRDHRHMVEHFSTMLMTGAPSRISASTNEALISNIASTVSGNLRSGRLDRLGELAPEFTFVILLPYLGFDEARRWTTRSVVMDD